MLLNIRIHNNLKKVATKNFFVTLFIFLISDMTREEAYELLKDCVKEIQKRLVINLPNFEVSYYKSIIYDMI